MSFEVLKQKKRRSPSLFCIHHFLTFNLTMKKRLPLVGLQGGGVLG
jgi:hypothetical protein